MTLALLAIHVLFVIGFFAAHPSTRQPIAIRAAGMVHGYRSVAVRGWRSLFSIWRD